MKSFKQILAKPAGIIGIVGLLAVLFSSCRKDRYYNDPYSVVNQSNTPAASITVINASPGSQPLSVYLDNNLTNNFSLSYGHILDYLLAYTGKRVAGFYDASTHVKLAADTINLVANTYYSLFLSGPITKPAFTLLTDTLSKPASGMINIRFINLSSDVGALDLGFSGTAAFVKNKNYKGFSSFSAAAANTYTIEARKAGTSTVAISLSNITLQSGSIYTVWVHGSVAATDQTRLTMDIQRNAY